MISAGEAIVFPRPMASAASGDSVTDFWARAMIAPPFDSFDLS